MPKRAVLLVNLGSPDSTSVADVRRYLKEFLGDDRVLDMNKALRWALLEGIILRSRPKKSAHAYATVWTPEGSPLVVTSNKVRDKLARVIGPETPVYLAMRYGNPSIAHILKKMVEDGIEEVLLFPQYPHYAMSSWETVVVKVFEEARLVAPAIRFTPVKPFYADEDYIEALQAVTAPYLKEPYDYVLFSYHGLPARHLTKADSSCAHCLKVTDCCETPSPAHATCYRAQCVATTKALTARLSIDPKKFSLSFQSRLAGEPWLEPYTDYEFERLPKAGIKKLLVICPAFVADCLETLEEISISGKASFLEAGGEAFTQIPCLNDQTPYIDFLAGRVLGWLENANAEGAGVSTTLRK